MKGFIPPFRQGLSLLLPIGLTALALVGLGVWFHRYGGRPQSDRELRPPTEGADLSRWMDRRLGEQLRGIGLSEQDFRREMINPREWDREAGDLRLLEVKVPEGLSSRTVQNAIEALARKVGVAVEVLWLRKEGPTRMADIRVEGFLTHRILIREIPRKPDVAPQAPRRPQIALIMDDLGNAYRPILPVFRIEAPLTLAVMPGRPFSHRIAREGLARGMELMIHLPMEPLGYPEKNPGSGALLSSMTKAELERVMMQDLEDIPQAKGINNHMGSKLTEDPRLMEQVMELMSKRGLYFVDSLTTPRSVAFHTANRMGIPAYRRDVFLDVLPGESGIRSQFRKLLRIARLQGHAIGICHPYPETLKLLPELVNLAKTEGFEWVLVSRIDRGQTAKTGGGAHLEARH